MCGGTLVSILFQLLISEGYLRSKESMGHAPEWHNKFWQSWNQAVSLLNHNPTYFSLHCTVLQSFKNTKNPYNFILNLEQASPFLTTIFQYSKLDTFITINPRFHTAKDLKWIYAIVHFFTFWSFFSCLLWFVHFPLSMLYLNTFKNHILYKSKKSLAQ